MRAKTLTQAWRTYPPRERKMIEARLQEEDGGCCPRCGAILEARPQSRMLAVYPVGVSGIDLECRQCHRFHPRVQHTDQSLYFTRIQRLASAIMRA
jgi:hypothetical protein